MMNEIRSLLVEREGYVRRGKLDRVASVDEALALLGYKPIETASVEPEAERAVTARAVKRKG